nr:hypothetical protein GCM10020093_073590 [Planobispora longispora]
MRREERLLPAGHLAGAGVDPDADDAEVPAVLGEDPPGVPAPSHHGIQRDQPGGELVVALAAGEPAEDLRHRVQAAGLRAVAGRSAAAGAEQARENRPRVHVHDVGELEQLADLPEGQPAEVLVDGHVAGDLHDDVPVALEMEPGALLRLQDVDEDPAHARLGEVLDVAGAPSPVHLGVVAGRRLDRGRQLHHVEVSGLHLGLHQEVQDAVEFLGDYPQDGDVPLHQNGLPPFSGVPVVRLDVQSRHAEESAAAVFQVPRVRGEVPAVRLRQLIQRYACALERLVSLLGEPVVDVRAHPGLGRQRRGGDTGGEVGRRAHAELVESRRQRGAPH